MDLQIIADALIAGKDKDVAALTEQAVNEGTTAKEILDGGLIAGMSVIGKRFKDCEIFLPEVLVAARAMKAGMEILKPLLATESDAMIGKVVLGTIKGDLHDIGKNLVGFMLEGAGFEVIDLGVDVAPDQFIQACQDNNAGIIGLSALLTTTMIGMKDVIDKCQELNLRETVKVVVGGAPLTQDFAQEIGADGFAQDAPGAVELCKELLGINN